MVLVVIIWFLYFWHRLDFLVFYGFNKQKNNYKNSCHLQKLWQSMGYIVYGEKMSKVQEVV